MQNDGSPLGAPPLHRVKRFIAERPGCSGCCGGCCVFGFLILFLAPFLPSGHVSSPASGCLSNAKQMSLGILMYAEDSDSRLPAAVRWMDEIHPYVKNEQVFHCPGASKEQDGAYGYAFNSRLSSQRKEKFKEPDRTLLLFDSSSLGRNASDPGASLDFVNSRHVPRGNVAVWLDGHAKFVTDPGQLFR